MWRHPCCSDVTYHDRNSSLAFWSASFFFFIIVIFLQVDLQFLVVGEGRTREKAREQSRRIEEFYNDQSIHRIWAKTRTFPENGTAAQLYSRLCILCINSVRTEEFKRSKRIFIHCCKFVCPIRGILDSEACIHATPEMIKIWFILSNHGDIYIALQNIVIKKRTCEIKHECFTTPPHRLCPTPR